MKKTNILSEKKKMYKCIYCFFKILKLQVLKKTKIPLKILPIQKMNCSVERK